MSFTPAEITTIGDLNFLARIKLTLYPGEKDRLLQLAAALKAGTYQAWPATEREPDHILGLMAATPDGQYAPNRALLTRFANAIHVGIAPVVRNPPLPDAGDDDPAPLPPPQTTPPPSGDISAQVRAALAQMGATFAADGTLSGFKLLSTGAPEGNHYAYVGSSDGALRIFSGIREKIGGAWPNVDVNRAFPVIMCAIERDGAISFDYDPPLLGTDPNPRPFKTLLVYLAGFLRGIGPRGPNNVGKYIDIGTFEKGRGVRLNVRRSGSTTPDIDTVLQFDPDHPDAVCVRVGGLLRRVTIDSNGNLAAGEVVNEDQ